MPLRLHNFLLRLKPDHMSRSDLICTNLITCRKGNLITCRGLIGHADLITCRGHAGSQDLITCRNQIRSHVAINFLIAPTWSHVADEAEISLSRYLFTVLNYQSTRFVSLSHFNTLALYCIKVLGRTSPLYHFNALKCRANAL